MDVICFGFKNFGQLAKEKFTSIRTVLQLPSTEGIKHVAFSWSKSYVLQDDGDLTIMGFIDPELNSIKKMKLPFDSKLKKMSCLGPYELYLTDEGSCWKYSNEESTWTNITSYLQSTIDRNNTDVSDFKIIDICSDDTLHLALSNTGIVFSIPVPIEMPALSKKVTKICCGLEHALFLTENGSVYVWGSGSRGQLGTGSLNSVEGPELLVCLDGIVVVEIAAGGWHSAAVTICGDLYTWGWNNFGQLAFPTNKGDKDNIGVAVLPEPKLVDWTGDKDILVKQVSCGTQHTVVLLEDGSVYGCGWNKYGQINPYKKEEYFEEMVNVPIPDVVNKVHRVSCTSWYSALYVS